MIKNYYKLLGEMVDALQVSGVVKFTDADYRYYSEVLSPDLYKKCRQLGFPAVLLEFYASVEFVNINWRLKPDFRQELGINEIIEIAGTLNIPKFNELLEMVENNKVTAFINPFSTEQAAEKVNLEDFIPFDVLYGKGAVCFKKREDKLYLIETDPLCKVWPLHLNLDEYLHLGITKFFFVGWQEYFVLKTKTNEEQIAPFFKKISNLKTNA